MKVVKDNTKTIDIPEKLQAHIKTNIDSIALCQERINNLVTGFLSLHEVPEGWEVSLSADSKSIVMTEKV
jgi:hypothetical protein